MPSKPRCRFTRLDDLRIRVPVDWPDPYLGSPRTRMVSASEFGFELVTLQHRVIATLTHDRVGVGLAAPQVSDVRRWIVLCVDAEDDAGLREPVLQMLVNPVLTPVPGAPVVTDRESCLSFPGLHLDIARPDAVDVRWQDPQDGSTHETRWSGYLARVVQHEVDHLDAFTLLHRVNRETRRAWLDQQLRLWRSEQKPRITM